VVVDGEAGLTVMLIKNRRDITSRRRRNLYDVFRSSEECEHQCSEVETQRIDAS
jgi:hypothetical protein